MKTKQLLLSAFVATIAITACKKDNPEPEPTPTPAETGYSNGVFITNEGPFGTGTGTVSFYDRSAGTVSNDIFETKNAYPLGNLVQSLEVFNGKAYIVVNNAGKVEIADAGTFASSGVINGLNSPRYFLGIDSNTGYITEWGTGGVNGAVKVVDLSSQTVTSTIPTGKGAETLLKKGNKVYVACSGGYDNDSVVTVIDATTNSVIHNIVVGANPKSIKEDANGKLWVLCSGQYDMTYTTLEKKGKLVRINADVDTVELSLEFSSTTSQPFNLVSNSSKTTLYYNYNGQVYSHNATATALNSTGIISRNFYSLGIDPTNDYFYGADAGNFSSDGKVLRYTSAGAVVDSFTVGIIPGNFYFKQ